MFHMQHVTLGLGQNKHQQPRQRPDQQAVNELMADLTEYGESAISGITFNTETGLPINTTLGGHNLEFVLVETITGAVSDTFGSS